MKRLFPMCFLAAVCLLMHARSTNAQVTALNLWFVSDTSYNGCALPATANVNAGGIVTGTPGPNDSVTMYFNYGTGADTTFKVPFVQSYFNTSFVRQHTMPGTYSTMAVATFNGLTDTAYSNSTIYSTNCQVLSGKLFVDANNDCLYNSGESPVPWRAMTVTNTSVNKPYYLISDQNGDYSVQVPPGNYTITPFVPGVNIAPTCPASGTANVTIGTIPVSQDFAYECNSTVPVDLSVNAYAPGFRPGVSWPLYMHTNSTNMCATYPATVVITLDPLLSYTATSNGIAPSSVSGNTLTWNVPNLSGLSQLAATLSLYCQPNAVIGDTVCITISVVSPAPETNFLNNTYTLCVPIRNSCDPNDKYVSPMGKESAGYIANGTELSYLINFQNTGNDVAYNIVVKDVLDSDLDFSTLRILEASHPMSATMVADNEIAFRFANINLPDSNTNEPASHGHIIYAVKPKAGLAPGTTIHNTADIYFDYNSAITTNTTLNTIEIPTGIQHVTGKDLKASIYPNPAQQQLHIKTEGVQQFDAMMFDVLGRCVQVQRGYNGNTDLDVTNLANGLYLLKINSGGKELSVRVNVQH